MLLIHDPEERVRALDFHDFEGRMRRLLRRHYGEDGNDFVVKSREYAGRSARTCRLFRGRSNRDRCDSGRDGWHFLSARGLGGASRNSAGDDVKLWRVSAKAGTPNSARAVGLANGANPIAIVVPCHRVIGADASLTGYGGGVDRKRWLLAHEGAA